MEISGIATGEGGQLTVKNLPKIGKKREKIRKKQEKREKIREKKRKIRNRRFFHFAPPDR